MRIPAAQWPIQHDLSLRHSTCVLHPSRNSHRDREAQSPERRDSPDSAGWDRGLTVEKRSRHFKRKSIRHRRHADVSVPMCTTSLECTAIPNHYWTVGGAPGASLRRITGSRKHVQKEVDRILSPGDSDETKLRKIYARASADSPPSATNRKKRRRNETAKFERKQECEDVLNHGYAFEDESIGLYRYGAKQPVSRHFLPDCSRNRSHLQFGETGCQAAQLFGG